MPSWRRIALSARSSSGRRGPSPRCRRTCEPVFHRPRGGRHQLARDVGLARGDVRGLEARVDPGYEDGAGNDAGISRPPERSTSARPAKLARRPWPGSPPRRRRPAPGRGHPSRPWRTSGSIASVACSRTPSAPASITTPGPILRTSRNGVASPISQTGGGQQLPAALVGRGAAPANNSGAAARFDQIRPPSKRYS